MLNMEWETVTVENAPPSRCNHGAAAIGNYFYIIGGRGDGHELRYNDVCIFDSQKREWLTNVNHKGTAVPPSSSFSLTVVGDEIFLFGGKSQDNFLNDTYSIRHTVEADGSSTVLWTKLECRGELPSPRFLHSSCLLGDKIFVFGGCTLNDECLNDLYMLNTRDLTWHRIEPLGTKPLPRSRHAHVLVSRNKMLILGGMDASDNNFSDCWCLEHKEIHGFRKNDVFTWTQIKPHGRKPPRLSGQTVNSYGTKVVVFGGLTDDVVPSGESINDTFVLDTCNWEWTKIEATGVIPEVRNGHRAASIGSKIYVHAGWHRRYLSDLCILETNIKDCLHQTAFTPFAKSTNRLFDADILIEFKNTNQESNTTDPESPLKYQNLFIDINATANWAMRQQWLFNVGTPITPLSASTFALTPTSAMTTLVTTPLTEHDRFGSSPFGSFQHTYSYAQSAAPGGSPHF